MPFPIIPVIIGVGTAASVGLQAHDTFNKTQPITLTTLPQNQKTQIGDYTPLLFLAAAIIFLLVVIR